MPESEKKFLWVKGGLLTKSCTQSRAPRTSSWEIIIGSKLMMNLSQEVTGPRTMRAVSWSTWEKQDVSFLIQTITRLYQIRHDTFFKQLLASTETSLPRAKLQDIAYVRAAFRWRPLHLSLILDKTLVFIPTSLNLTAFDPPPFRKSIQEMIQQMQQRVVVSTNDVGRAKTTISLSNFGTSSYGGQHRVREFFQKSTGVSLQLSFKYKLPILLKAANTRVPDKKSLSAIGGNFDWLASRFCSHCSTRGNEDACLIFWRRQ